MFRNIKQLSEYSSRHESLIFVWAKPQPEIVNPWGQEEAAKEVSAAERLEALRNSMAGDFKKHLEEYRTEIGLFIASDEVKQYRPEEWKEWNVKLLEYMGFKNVNPGEAAGIVKRLQEYLKTINSNVEVDGKFGPNLLKALEAYYSKDERSGWVPPLPSTPSTPQPKPPVEPKPEPPKPTTPVAPGLVAEAKKEGQVGWVEGVTKYYFFLKAETSEADTTSEANLQGEVFYVLNDGKTWVDYLHNRIDLEQILPKLAGAGSKDINGYYRVTDGSGVLHYVDRQGKMYAGIPTTTGTEQWAKAEPKPAETPAAEPVRVATAETDEDKKKPYMPTGI